MRGLDYFKTDEASPGRRLEATLTRKKVVWLGLCQVLEILTANGVSREGSSPVKKGCITGGSISTSSVGNSGARRS